MFFTITLTVFTLLTFALECAWDSSFIAFAIFLLTLWIFTITSFKMLIFIFINFAFKSLDVSLKYFFDSPSSIFYMIIIIKTVTMLMALTIRSTSSIISQTLTIQLQALGIFTLTSLTSNKTWLVLLPLYQCLLGNCLPHYLSCLLFYLLFKQLVF